MPANCSCHPVEVPYKNDRAGHRPPSSPLATPPSWGDVTPAATALASIWAQIYVQVCVPVTCQKSCISQKKDARRQAFQIQRQTQTSAAELNPKSWNKGAVLALCIWETRQKKNRQVSSPTLHVSKKATQTPVRFCLQCTEEIFTHTCTSIF